MQYKMCLAGLLILFSTVELVAQDTSFNYQGRLLQSGFPAQGLFDFQFSIFNVPGGGAPLAADELVNDLNLDQGIFNVDLDFASAILNNQDLWLEIRVRASGNGSFTLLSPRQQLVQSPRAARTEHTAFNSVNSASIANGSVNSAKIITGGVRSVNILDGSITSNDVNTSQIQRRVTGTCPNFFGIRQVNADGSVNCEEDLGIFAFIEAGTFTVSAENGAVDITGMLSTSRHICMLSSVQLRNVDGGAEDAFCRVRIQGSIWVLEATSENDSDAFCSALCVRFDP